MMVLGTLCDIEPSVSEELRLLRTLKQKTTQIVPVISLAKHLAESGLVVNAYHENADMFWSSIVERELRDEQLQRYEEARNAGVHIDTTTPVNANLVTSCLRSGKLLLCGIEMPGSSTKHALFAYGVAGEDLLLIDPLCGKVQEPITQFLAEMRTGFGSWCISVEKKSA